MSNANNLNLADAILMGSSVVKPKAGVQHEGAGDEQAGCALGMANIAAGAIYREMTQDERYAAAISNENNRSRGAASVWGEWVKKVVARPCECTHKTQAELSNDGRSWIVNYMLNGSTNNWAFNLLAPELPIQDVITHLFDTHVMGEPATWTIEQLADWVRTVEGPAREEEKARRQKELMEMYWPVTYASPYLMGLGGAIAPGNDIRYEANPDGSITRYPEPSSLLGGYSSAMASNSHLDTSAWKTSEITLEMIQKMVEKIKALPEEIEK